ncbi:hypothetical protein J4G37_59275, partial [Microvirga sp. 3-52]|nr:hypothetical protein [Microvirga sp. 3-52]
FTDIRENSAYKYEVHSQNGTTVMKADPYALESEIRPANASITPTVSSYEWNDQQWQKEKQTLDPFASPISIYEVHLGSWKTKQNNQLEEWETKDASDFYTYR